MRVINYLNATLADVLTGLARGALNRFQVEYLSHARITRLLNNIMAATGLDPSDREQWLPHILRHTHGTTGPFWDQYFENLSWLGMELDIFEQQDGALSFSHEHGMPQQLRTGPLLFNMGAQTQDITRFLRTMAANVNQLVATHFPGLVDQLPIYPQTFAFLELAQLAIDDPAKYDEFVRLFLDNYINIIPRSIQVVIKLDGGSLVPTLWTQAGVVTYFDASIESAVANGPPSVLLDYSQNESQSFYNALQAALNTDSPYQFAISPYSDILTLLFGWTSEGPVQDVTLAIARVLAQYQLPVTAKLNFLNSGFDPRALALTAAGFHGAFNRFCANVTALPASVLEQCGLLAADLQALPNLTGLVNQTETTNVPTMLERYFGRGVVDSDTSRYFVSPAYFVFSGFLLECLMRVSSDYFSRRRNAILDNAIHRLNGFIDERALACFKKEAFFRPYQLRMTSKEAFAYRMTYVLEIIPFVVKTVMGIYALACFTAYIAVEMNAIYMLPSVAFGMWGPSIADYAKNKSDLIHNAVTTLKEKMPIRLTAISNDIANNDNVKLITHFLTSNPEVHHQLKKLVGRELFYIYLMIILLTGVTAYTASAKCVAALAVLAGTTAANMLFGGINCLFPRQQQQARIDAHLPVAAVVAV